ESVWRRPSGHGDWSAPLAQPALKRLTADRPASRTRSVIYDWGGKVRESGQVGGRAYAPKRYSTHRFGWDGGSNGHPNGRGNAFLVLSGRYDGRDQIKKHNNNTSGVAQQNASRIWPETRSIGRSTTFDR